jgi:selenocysteine lyase/cysteine desulfurase
VVVASHRHSERNPGIYESLHDQGVDIALRRGNLRFSPHLYNTTEEIDQALDALAAAAA